MDTLVLQANMLLKVRRLNESDEEYSYRMKRYDEYLKLFRSVMDYEFDVLQAGHSYDILPGESDDEYNARQKRHHEYVEQAKLLSTLRTKFEVY